MAKEKAIALLRQEVQASHKESMRLLKDLEVAAAL